MPADGWQGRVANHRRVAPPKLDMTVVLVGHFSFAD